MCRAAVNYTYLENPDLLDDSHRDVDLASEDKILWFYQARSRGWWLYERRIASEIESRLALSLVQSAINIFSCTVLILTVIGVIL